MCTILIIVVIAICLLTVCSFSLHTSFFTYLIRFVPLYVRMFGFMLFLCRAFSRSLFFTFIIHVKHFLATQIMMHKYIRIVIFNNLTIDTVTVKRHDRTNKKAKNINFKPDPQYDCYRANWVIALIHSSHWQMSTRTLPYCIVFCYSAVFFFQLLTSVWFLCWDSMITSPYKTIQKFTIEFQWSKLLQNQSMTIEFHKWNRRT